MDLPLVLVLNCIKNDVTEWNFCWDILLLLEGEVPLLFCMLFVYLEIDIDNFGQ